MQRNSAYQFCRVVLALGALLAAGTTLARAGTFTAFGPQDYTRGTGDPVTVTNTFTVLNPNTQYTLKAFNGGLQDTATELVSSGFVTVNGVQVLGPSNFNQNVTEVDIPVTLQASNTISVQVRGQPGGVLTVQIIGVDNDPPTIKAALSPAANAAGWNNTPVTVTFTCDDQTSGVASCPASQTVINDGANQVISGTATDKAGNTASTSVTINLDKTPPSIAAAAFPGPNTGGWNNTPVTVQFTCGDALSGVAVCPQTQIVSADGRNQVISGTATDVAGNKASASVTVNLDQTPPSIKAAVSPAANAAGWNQTNATVTFSCSDATSGIASCPPPQTISSEGGNQVIAGTATDIAGNVGSDSVVVNLDKTPPSVNIVAPVNGSTISLSTVSIGLNGNESDNLSGVSTVTCNGSPAAISGPNFTCTVLLTQGSNSISVQAIDVAGNTSSSPLSLTYAPAPQIAISSPVNLSITNLSPATVIGTVSDPAATVTVNGIAAPQSGGSFTIPVPLVEGLNVLTAVATNASGTASTATVQVTLDTTPPHITIDSPADGSTTTAASVTVTGLANDVVVGTVNAQDVQVTVNGIAAQVANRSYSAANVPLAVGANVIQASGRDHAGNGATTSITVTRVPPSQPPPPAIGTAVITQSLSIVSGNNQTGTVGTQLSTPLIVSVTDPANHPVANQTVVFKVTGNNGTLSAPGSGTASSAVAVTTDLTGQAQASWTLGDRAGAGINTVQATATLAIGSANFTATAVTANASQIVVDSGNDQTGVVGQPLGFPFVADVVDAGHNRVPNVPVTFTIKQGDGNLGGVSNQTVTTDSNGRAIAVLTLGTQIGNDNNVVEATFPNNPGFSAAFAASARAPGIPANTTISGVVLDNSNNPIPGVTIRLFATNQGNNNNLPVQIGTPVQTNANGTFLIQPAPVGFFKLMADGTTASGPNSYPPLEYDIVTVAGNNNTVGMPIYLPALDAVNKLCVDETHGGTLTLPQVPGFALTVLPGSATFPGGSRQGCVSVTPVNGDKVPMAPGFGQQPRFIVTIQPVGTTFNPPAPITLPNVDGLAPKAVTEMYSYDHDLGMFVAIGTGTVSNDGSVIASNAGVGVLKAGWHCGGNPAANGTVADCPTCKLCLNNSCNNVDPAQDKKSCTTDSVPVGVCANGDCTPITAKVKQVTFSGAGFHNISKDDGTAYGTPQWTDSGNKFPVSYTNSSTVTVGATFELSNSLASGNVQVTGTAAGGFQFQGAGTLSGTTVTLSNTASSQTLPGSLTKLDPFQIQWKLTIDGKDVDAGASTNTMYVTLHDPTASPLYETLLLIDGRTADGATADASAAASIWTDFQHTASGVTRADGTAMVYWHAGVAPGSCQTLAGMLFPKGAGDPNNGNGSCIAWSQLFQGTLFAQGITPANILQITADTTINPGAQGFLVKNWNFGKHIRTGSDGIRHSDLSGDDEEVFPKGQGLPNVPCVIPGTGHVLASTPAGDDVILAGAITTGADGICNTTAAGTDVQVIAVGKGQPNSVCIGPGPDGILNSTAAGGDTVNDGVFNGQLYPYLVGFDARDQLGVQGQGNPDPPGAFLNHFVVTYNGQIYDPSYGTGPFATQLAHENAAAAGIFANTTSGATVAKKKAATRELNYQ